MASTLLNRLNALTDKTPDEIVLALQPHIYFMELTRDVAEPLQGHEMVLFKYRFNEQRWVVDEHDWEFWGYSEEAYFRRVLWNYAGILKENYINGIFPTRTPERTEE